MKKFLKAIKAKIETFIYSTGRKTLLVIGIFIGIIFTLLCQKI